MGHHFSPASMIIVPPSPSSYPSYELIFMNNDTGEQVRMTIPRYGMFSDSDREITPDEVDYVAHHIAHFLHNYSGGGAGDVIT